MINPNCARTDEQYIDLTHLLENSIPVFPGDNSLILDPTHSVNEDGYANSRLSMGMHVGTHMDGAAHMIDGGRQLYEYEPERFFGYCDIVDATDNDGIISIDILEQLPEKKARMLLIKTDHSQHYTKDFYYEEYPVLSEELAHKIVELEYDLVGLDTPSPDKFPYGIHQILLGNDILIVENLKDIYKLSRNKDIFLTVLPLLVKADSAPVRVIAEVM